MTAIPVGSALSITFDLEEGRAATLIRDFPDRPPVPTGRYIRWFHRARANGDLGKVWLLVCLTDLAGSGSRQRISQMGD